MVDFRLLNGKPRATLIQRFDGSILLLGPKGKKIEFKDGVTLHQIQAKVAKLGWVIGVEHLHREISKLSLLLASLENGDTERAHQHKISRVSQMIKNFCIYL